MFYCETVDTLFCDSIAYNSGGWWSEHEIYRVWESFRESVPSIREFLRDGDSDQEQGRIDSDILIAAQEILGESSE